VAQIPRLRFQLALGRWLVLFGSACRCGRQGFIIARMDPTRFRLRYLLGILAAAALTAAALRHSIHVNGGFSREEIRTYALVATALIALAVFFFRMKRRP
jgi:hypothetical protein